MRLPKCVLLYFAVATSSCLALDVPWKIGDKSLVPKAGETVVVDSNALAQAPAPAVPYELRFEALVPNAGQGEPDFGTPQIWFSVDYRDQQDQLAFSLRGGRLQDAIAYDFYQRAFVGTKTVKQFARENISFDYRYRRLPDRSSAPITTGKWVSASVRVVADRAELWVNEKYVMTVNREHGANSTVALGGSWHSNSFRNVDVAPLSAEKVAAIRPSKLELDKPDPDETEKRRQVQRAGYQALMLADAPASGYGETSLDGNWLFMPDNTGSLKNAASPELPDNGWHVLPVPAFWNPIGWWCWGNGNRMISRAYLYEELTRCEQYTFDWAKTASGWYRKHLEVPASYKGKRVTMEFGGISTIYDVYVNGKPVGSNMGMFRPFSVELSPHLQPGQKNVVAVHVGNGERNRKGTGQSVIAASVTVTDEMATELPNAIYSVPVGEDSNRVSKRHGGIWQSVKLRVGGEVHFGEVWPQTNGKSLKLRVAGEVPAQPEATRLVVVLEDATGKGVLKKDLAWSKFTGELEFADLPVERWSPEAPNLYTLKLALVEGGKNLDTRELKIGFRDIAIRDGKFELNGSPWRFIGANMPPHGLRINDKALAKKFVGLMKEGGQRGVRGVCSPFPAEWMDEMDQQGISVSYEGQWPWIMIESLPIPDQTALKVWKEEWIELVKANRHRPSIVMWTISNEAYPLRDIDPVRRQKKWDLWQDIVKATREADPTRPIVLYSGWVRGLNQKEIDAIGGSKDDGDIDDFHCKPGTYNPSMVINPEQVWTRLMGNKKTPGRAYMSQEPGTAYSDTDLGHQELDYLRTWQGQTWTGRESYPYHSPAFYLARTARLTKEQMEIARSQDVQGWLSFCNATWYSNVDRADLVRPFSIADEFRFSMEPRLVALMRPTNRVFEASKVPLEVYVVNDAEKLLGTPWKIEVVLKSSEGKSLSEPVALTIQEPALGGGVGKAKIELVVKSLALEGRKEAIFYLLARDGAGKVISENRYPVGVFPSAMAPVGKLPVIGAAKALKEWESRFAKLGLSIGGDFANAPLGVAVTPSEKEWAQIIKQAEAGQRVLVIEANTLPQSPIWHGAKLVKTGFNGEMADFTELGRKLNLANGLKPQDMAWWRGEEPMLVVYSRALTFAKEYPAQVQPLVDHILPHGYNGIWKVEFPVVRFEVGKGQIVVCTLNFEALESDPAPFVLLQNLIKTMK